MIRQNVLLPSVGQLFYIACIIRTLLNIVLSMLAWMKMRCWKKFMANVLACMYHEAYVNEQVEANVASLTSVHMKIETECTRG